MKIYELTTPSFLVDLAILEQNIKEMSELCQANGKELWPMIKTHKCTAIAKLQQRAGAAGFLTGTLDEAKGLIDEGFNNIMLAYPVAAKENIARVIKLAARASVTISLDGLEAARQINEALLQERLKLDYLLIIDSGLQRFGVRPEQASLLAREIAKLEGLNFKGIATHPGHVYGAASPEAVLRVAQEEEQSLQEAGNRLSENGFKLNIVATGSTPTVKFAVKDQNISVVRPGNYVFYDNIQLALGIATPEQCSLTVLATILAQPKPDIFIIDAGSKCLGLDMGAHGNTTITSFGKVKDYPELSIISLSEEVGKIKIAGSTQLRVGDKIRIIPNHACAAANMTSYLIGHRKGEVKEVLPVDMRGGSKPKY